LHGLEEFTDAGLLALDVAQGPSHPWEADEQENINLQWCFGHLIARSEFSHEATI